MNCWPLVLLLFVFFRQPNVFFFFFFFKAGLSVGDMILCVNKDELLGADYDTVKFLFLFLIRLLFPFGRFISLFPFPITGGFRPEESRGHLDHRRLQSERRRRCFRRRQKGRCQAK